MWRWLALQFVLSAAAATVGGQAALSQGALTVSSVISVRTTDPVVALHYTYSFPSEPAVVVDGFGMAPNSGDLTYLTRDKTIRIRTLQGAILAERTLPPASIAMGDDEPVDLGHDFDEAVREVQFHDSKLFSVNLTKTLGATFPFGVERRRQDDLYIAVTTYQSFSVTRYVTLRVSVRVSYPHGTKDAPTVWLQYSAFEKPAKDAAGPVTSAAAKDRLAALLNELVRQFES